VNTTSERTGPKAQRSGTPSVVAPLLQELQRISGHAETERAAADQALIAELREEVAALRAAVAHLRARTAALPRELRPVVARAVLSTEATGRAVRRRLTGPVPDHKPRPHEHGKEDPWPARRTPPGPE
jgi:hypothetical protein